MKHPVSVVVVNYNTRELLAPLLQSLLRQSHTADEIIVVDNGSTDGSEAYLLAEWRQVRTVRLMENLGFGGGCNRGVAEANNDLVALINSDCVADVFWLERLVREIVSGDEKVAAVVPKILRSDRRTVEQAGANFNQVGYCWGRGHKEVDRGQFDSAGEVPVLTGCAVLFRRSAVGNLPFDEELFMYYEELELSLRLWGSGWSIRYVPDAICWHAGRASLVKLGDPELLQQLFCNRNRLKIFFKFYSVAAILSALPALLTGLAVVNLHLLTAGGIRFTAKAVYQQIRFVRSGLRERHLVTQLDRALWRDRMTQQTMGEMRRLHAGWRAAE